jgi:hypothetical protein
MSKYQFVDMDNAAAHWAADAEYAAANPEDDRLGLSFWEECEFCEVGRRGAGGVYFLGERPPTNPKGRAWLYSDAAKSALGALSN